MRRQPHFSPSPRRFTVIADLRTHAIALLLCITGALALAPTPTHAQATRDSLSTRPGSPESAQSAQSLQSQVPLSDRPPATTLPPATIRSWQVGILRPDRLQHTSTSFAIAVGGGITTEDRASAFAISLGIGLLKECWDARRGRFDPVDLACDATGALLGALTTGRH